MIVTVFNYHSTIMHLSSSIKKTEKTIVFLDKVYN